MKKILLLIFLACATRVFGAAAAYDIILSQRPDSGTGPNVERLVTPTAGYVIGFDGSKHPTAINLGGLGFGNVTASGTLTNGDIVIGQGTKAVATTGTIQVVGSNATVNGNLSVTNNMTVGNLTAGNLTISSPITVANGGTGLATLTANSIVIGNGTNTPILLAPGTAGNLATSDGTSWNSTAPSFFKNIVVSGCTTVSSNTTGNLTLVAGGNITITTDNTAKSVTIAASGGGSAGTKTIAILNVLTNEPPAGNYATFNTRNNHPVLEFDTTTQEIATWTCKVPEGASMTNGVTVYVQWCAATATSGTIGWDVAFERIVDGGIDIDSDNFGTAKTITAATVSGTSGITSVTSVNFSQSDLPTSLAAGDMYRIRIRRDVANDTATGDAQLLQGEVRLQ